MIVDTLSPLKCLDNDNDNLRQPQEYCMPGRRTPFPREILHSLASTEYRDFD